MGYRSAQNCSQKPRLPANLNPRPSHSCPRWHEEDLARTLCSDLDSLLAQFLESHSIHIKLVYRQPGPEDVGKVVAGCSVYLFPGSIRRGIIDLVGDPIYPNDL
jgi:hypothetical protein